MDYVKQVLCFSAAAAGCAVGVVIRPIVPSLFYKGTKFNKDQIEITRGREQLLSLGGEEHVIPMTYDDAVILLQAYLIPYSDFRNRISKLEDSHMVIDRPEGSVYMALEDFLDTPGGSIPSFLSKTPAASKGTVIMFIGVGSACETSGLSQALLFLKLGYNVLMANYPGYIQSEGKPSGDSFEAFGQAVADYLVDKLGESPINITVTGTSIGGTAAAAATKQINAKKLILFNTFATMPACPAAGPFLSGILRASGVHHRNSELLNEISSSTSVLLVTTEGDEIVGAQSTLLASSIPQNSNCSVLNIPCISHESMHPPPMLTSRPEGTTRPTSFFQWAATGRSKYRFSSVKLAFRVLKGPFSVLQTKVQNHSATFYLMEPWNDFLSGGVHAIKTWLREE